MTQPARQPHAQPEYVVFAAIEQERARLREAFTGVYRADGSINEEALQRFARMLGRQP